MKGPGGKGQGKPGRGKGKGKDNGKGKGSGRGREHLCQSRETKELPAHTARSTAAGRAILPGKDTWRYK